MSAVIVAVDGGNSKTDVALIAADGAVLGTARAASGSYHQVGMKTMLETITAAVRSAACDTEADGITPKLGVYCLAGADLPVDDRRLQRELDAAGLAEGTIILNDAFAGLRAGSQSGWGISLVCGAGMNCAGVGPTGRTVRFPALGALSGDEGGGGDLAVRALAAAIRARDGRGQSTSLERLVPDYFGLRHPIDVVTALHTDDLPMSALPGLAPVVFAAASNGDSVARGLADWLADELVLMGVSAIHRLQLARSDFEVVFVGSIWKTEDSGFHDRVREGLLAAAPGAILRRLEAPPVLGAALLGSDRLKLGSAAETRIRAELTAERLRTS
ncbi:MAG: ATPase [Acidimicrobiia bacterium]|nr:ATPase [Acidimicrobiia bacterium]MXZ07046.1 ATPase [Acidimicrobiia bacterium]